MYRYQYLNILKNKMVLNTCQFNSYLYAKLWHETQKFKLSKVWFYKDYIPVLEWPAQSSDLNSIDNPWNDVKYATA